MNAAFETIKPLKLFLYFLPACFPAAIVSFCSLQTCTIIFLRNGQSSSRAMISCNHFHRLRLAITWKPLWSQSAQKWPHKLHHLLLQSGYRDLCCIWIIFFCPHTTPLCPSIINKQTNKQIWNWCSPYNSTATTLSSMFPSIPYFLSTSMIYPLTMTTRIKVVFLYILCIPCPLCLYLTSLWWTPIHICCVQSVWS